MEKADQRIAKWDNVRFFLILSVVIGHLVDSNMGKSGLFRSIFLFIYSFHMPLFIFISGLFAKSALLSREKAINRAFIFMVLGISLSILMLMTHFAFSDMPVFRLLSNDSVPWYMFVLAIYMPLTYFLRHLNMKYLLAAAVLLACAAGYDKSIGDFFYLSRAIVFYPFFLAGYWLDSEQLLKTLNRPAVRTVSVILLAAAFLICICFIDQIYGLRPYFTGRNPFRHKIGFIIRLGCYGVSAVMGACVISAVPNRRIKILTSAGMRTLQVYFLHQNCIIILKQSGFFELIKAAAGPSAGEAAVLAAGTALTLILAAKILEYPFRQVMKIEVYPMRTDRS